MNQIPLAKLEALITAWRTMGHNEDSALSCAADDLEAVLAGKPLELRGWWSVVDRHPSAFRDALKVLSDL